MAVECHPDGIHHALREVECPLAVGQPITRRIIVARTTTIDKEGPSTTYHFGDKNGESEHLLRALAEFQFAMKDLKRSIELQVN